jgi:hypothetical protein
VRGAGDEGDTAPGQEAKDVMVVEGVFRLLWRPPGNGFPGYWEYRIEGAVGKITPRTVRGVQRATVEPLLPSVITKTGLDIHRYICSGWFGVTRNDLPVRGTRSATAAAAGSAAAPGQATNHCRTRSRTATPTNAAPNPMDETSNR